jgi:flagellin-like protein
MNVFGKRARGWRKNQRRGVSPIIATILLVAITVVLAAVLYVLVSGLTRTGASTPYSLGMAVNSATGSGSTWVVNLALSPTSGLTTGAFGLSVVNNVGVAQATEAAPAACKAYAASPTTSCTGVAGGWYGVLVASNGTVAATYSGATAGWTGYGTGVTTISLSGSYTLWVVSAVTYDGAGYVISAFGTGTSSVSGSANL